VSIKFLISIVFSIKASALQSPANLPHFPHLQRIKFWEV